MTTTFDLPEKLDWYQFEHGLTITANVNGREIEIEATFKATPDEYLTPRDIADYGEYNGARKHGRDTLYHSEGDFVVDRKNHIILSPVQETFSITKKTAEEWGGFIYSEYGRWSEAGLKNPLDELDRAVYDEKAVVEYRGKLWYVVETCWYTANNGQDYLEVMAHRVYSNEVGTYTHNWGDRQYRYLSGFRYTLSEYNTPRKLKDAIEYVRQDAEANCSFGYSWGYYDVEVVVSHEGTDIGEASQGGIENTDWQYVYDCGLECLNEALGQNAIDYLESLEVEEV